MLLCPDSESNSTSAAAAHNISLCKAEIKDVRSACTQQNNLLCYNLQELGMSVLLSCVGKWSWFWLLHPTQFLHESESKGI